MNQETKTIHLYRIIFASLSGLGIISVFLPWLTFDFYSLPGIQGDGWLALLTFIAVAVLSFIGQRSQGLSKGFLIAIGVLGLVSFSLPIYDWLIYLSVGGFELLDDVELGFGAYLTILASLGLIGLAVYCFVTANKSQAANLNFDTEKVGKVFSDGAQIIKAAGSAASQAVKKTVEEQKVNQQAAAPTHGKATPNGATQAPNQSASNPATSTPVQPAPSPEAAAPVSEPVSPSPVTPPPVQPVSSQPSPSSEPVAPEVVAPVSEPVAPSPATPNSAQPTPSPESQGVEAEVPSTQQVPSDPWLSASPVGTADSSQSSSEPSNPGQNQ